MSDADDTLPPNATTLQRAFEALVSTLQTRKISYALIGGLAVVHHIRIRATDDIDVLLAVPQLAMPGLFEALKEQGFDVDVIRNIREFRDGGLTTLRYQNVLVDLMAPFLPAYTHVLNNATEAEVFGQKVRVSSAEGLIVMKLIGMRPQDEIDVRDLLRVYGVSLNLDYIRTELDAVMDANDPRRLKFEEWVRQAIQKS